VGLSPLGIAATSGLLYKPQMIDEGDCGAIGGIKTGRGNREITLRSFVIFLTVSTGTEKEVVTTSFHIIAYSPFMITSLFNSMQFIICS
jgi:hypothetical protein